MFSEVIYLVLGIFLVWVSAEVLIRASQVIADKLKISETFIGLTILSIGTSFPELGTHIAASLKILEGVDVSDLAIATNIGSNIIQITVILGIVAIFMKVYATKEFLKKDYMVMIGSILMLFLFALDGKITKFEGFVLVFSYLLYLWSLAKVEGFVEKIGGKYSKKEVLVYALLIPVAIAALLFFADMVVGNAQILSIELGVSQSLIGALIIGVGTALPELAGSLVALKRKSSGMSVGILVGSNITNPLFCLGIGALISAYSVGSRILWFDLPIWFFISLIVLLFFWRKKLVEKKEASILIALYVVYFLVRVIFIG